MKKYIVALTLIITAGSIHAADLSAQDEVKAAAVALSNQANYSWHTGVTSPGGGGRFNGPTDGKTEKGGYTWLSMTRGDNTNEAVLLGEKGAAKTSDDNSWQSLADMAKDDGGGGFNPKMFLARMLQNYKTPDAQATNLLNGVKDLKKDGDSYSSDLTGDGAKALLTFGRRGGGDGPTVSNAKGSVKFWVKAGVLAKYEFTVSGTISFNGNDRDIDRTTTVEIKDVGTTKVEIPADAKKSL